MQAHDFIEVRASTKTRIFEKCAPLYEKGLSIRDISAQTGIPKTTVRETLVKSGMVLRNPLNGNGKRFDNKSVKRGGATPYGWAYLDGKPVIDPKEHLIIRQIINLHQSGKSNQQIADELNSKKVSTRNRGVWRRCTIRSIIIRNKEKPKNGGSNE